MRRRPFIEEVSEAEYDSRLWFASGPVPPVSHQPWRPAVLVSPKAQPALSAEDYAELIRNVTRWREEIQRTSYLTAIGVDAAVRLLIGAFGRKAVKAALSNPGAPLVIESSTKHEIVWTLVEMRRAAYKQTIKQACQAIARHGGIRASDGIEPRTTGAQIEKDFYDADKVLRAAPNIQQELVLLIQGDLVGWRRSRKPYDDFELERLGNYRIVERGTA